MGIPEARGPDESETVQLLKSIKLDMMDEYLTTSHAYPWIVGYSGGKDSTLLLQLVFEMLLDLAPGDRKRPVHVLSNDTLVESPILATYVDRMLDRVRHAAESLRLPATVAKTTPARDQTFWVNLIGRGYPSPNRSFRWCTDRMKIQPTSNYIRTQVDANGQVILLLGVRRDESARRAQSVKKYDSPDGSRLNAHNELRGCLVYRPIVDLATSEVWELLMQRPPPWGGSNRDLITLYRNAQGGECPLVLDKSDAPSCGTASSRFGCWTCTVVEKDKSAEGFIEAGFDHLEPLLEFRDWLAQIRNDRERRTVERRNGSMTYLADGKSVPGPFTLRTREEVLTRLLALQEDTGIALISADEVSVIKSIWAEDAAEAAMRMVRLSLSSKE
jgi:DNA sulfur modification protein DndC